MADAAVKRKVITPKVHLNNAASSRPQSRPQSPTKPHFSSTSSSVVSTMPRPKAKVNSSATPTSIRKTPSNSSTSSSSVRSPLTALSSFGSASPSTTPRSLSPARPSPRSRNDTITPPIQPKAKPIAVVPSNLRPQSSQSSPTTPESRVRSLTTTASDANIRVTNLQHTRRGSTSLHHAVSFSSLHRSNASSRSGSPTRAYNESNLGLSDQDGNGSSPGIRITAKVSGMAKASSETAALPPSPTFPFHPSNRPIQIRARAPSINSAIARFENNGTPSTPPNSLPLVVYPITTSSPAANPHRFATTRTSPYPPYLNNYRSFPLQPRDDLPPRYNLTPSPKSLPTKVDPTLIPLPLHSPPHSALSFSSHSSVSQSSASVAPSSLDGSQSSTSPHSKQQNGLASRTKLDLSVDTIGRGNSTYPAEEALSAGDSGHDLEGDSEEVRAQRKIKAEAKSIRKIADLEITNKSLLAINASLEATKHKQAKEIRDLRRKLRESRLILPPRTYRAVKSSLGPDDPGEADDDDDDDDDDDEDNDNDESGDNGDGNAMIKRNGQKKGKPSTGDEAYRRVRLMLDNLMETGKRALERKPEDFSDGKAVAKVLTAEEVRSWRDSTGGDGGGVTGVDGNYEPGSRSFTLDNGDDDDDADLETNGRPTTNGDESFVDSEDEVEALTMPTFSPPSSPPPPITITEPS